MRRVHATSRDQLAELPLGHGWFDLEDVAFDAEASRVVVPFRVLDEAVVVEAPPGLVRRLRRRSGDRYACRRRWLLLIDGAVGFEMGGDGVVLATPPSGSRPIAPSSRS